MKKAASPFAETIKAAKDFLDEKFTCHLGCNLKDNIQALERLINVNKFEFESLLSQVSIISITDDEFRDIRELLHRLLKENQSAAKNQGLFIDPCD